MAQKSFDSIEMIRSDEIDSQDRLFAVSLPWVSVDRLIRSIRKAGILSPLHVQRTQHGKFRIIMGFRRYQVSRKLEIQEVPCFVRDQEDELTLFVEALEDNLVTRPLHLLEKAHALLALRHRFGVSDQVLLEDFMARLDIRANRFNLRRYLDLARLPESLQQSLLDPLEPEVALELASWNTQEQDFFLRITSKFRLGKNKQKQLIAVLDELRTLEEPMRSTRGAGDLEAIWHRSGAAKIEQDERLPPSERFAKAFKELYRLRFPHLSQYEEQYERLKAALKMPSQIQFHVPRYFEGDQIDVLFSFRDSKELFELAKKLEEVSKADELKGILALL